MMNYLAGIGFLLVVFCALLAFVSLLWIMARVGNEDRRAKLL